MKQENDKEHRERDSRMEEMNNKIDFLGWARLVAVVIGGVVIALLQYQILQRQDEKQAYADILDGIIEMKEWAANEPVIMDHLRKTDVVKEYFANENIQLDSIDPNDARDHARTLMSRAILFYHLERVYYLSRQSGISDKEREGLDREISLWLMIDGMKQFYEKFVKPNENQTKEFMEKVDELYMHKQKLKPIGS